MRLLLALVLSIVTLFSYPQPLLAASYQSCVLGQDCTIGEFLYQDDYSLYTGATCTFTSDTPSGVSYTTATGAATEDSGWYYKSFTSAGGDEEGLYPTTMCCTAGSDYLCLDKSFELLSPSGSSLTAANIADAVLDEAVADHTTAGSLGGNLQNASFTVSDIWNNPTRTLSSFGSLVGDIWGYSTRSLTTFGSLVGDIWGSGSNTTSSNSSDLTTIKSELEEQKKSLEAIVNAPIVKSYIEEGQSPDLTAKIDETRENTNALYAKTSTAKTRLEILALNWSKLDKQTAESELRTLISLVADSNDSILSLTTWLDQAWGNPITSDSLNLATAASKSLEAALDSTSYYGVSSVSQKSVNSVLVSLTSLETLIGNIGSSAGDPTLFGHLKKITERAQKLDDSAKALTGLINNQKSLSTSQLTSEVNKVEASVNAINEFPYSLKVLTSIKSSLANKLYSLKALIDINKKLLATKPTDTPSMTWLEDGSVVFRTVITNPSTLITQTKELKYMLPKELKKEDIIDLSPQLTIDYDPDNDTLYAYGSFELKPEEAVVVFVETQDVWVITDDDLNAIRAASEAYIDSLEGSSLLAQALATKSELDSILSEVASSSATTPSERIQAYRANSIKLLTATEKLVDLQQITKEHTTTSSITGFIGGSQAITAWGLIAIFLAGFSFLIIYMKSLLPSHRQAKSGSEIGSLTAATTINLRAPRLLIKEYALPITIVVLALVTTIGALIFNKMRKPALQAPIVVPSATFSPTPSPSSSPVEENKLVLGESQTLSKYLEIESGKSVNLRSGPGVDYPIVVTLQSSTEVFIFGTDKDLGGESWSQVGLTSSDSQRGWWILTSFLK